MSVASTVPAARLAVAAARLPASPRIFIRLQTALRDPEVSVSQLVELVCVDSALASGVLRVSNSPVFRRGVPVTNLDEAINRIGLREVHRLVGLAMAMQLSQDGLPLYHVSADVLWENTLSVAIAASRLAMNAGEDDRQAYALGLLRSIGRQTLQLIAREDRIAALAEPATSIAALERWEQEVFGLTAMDAAVRLLTGWGFAGAACEPLRSHLCPERCAMRSPLAAILHLAGWVAETLGKGPHLRTRRVAPHDRDRAPGRPALGLGRGVRARHPRRTQPPCARSCAWWVDGTPRSSAGAAPGAAIPGCLAAGSGRSPATTRPRSRSSPTGWHGARGPSRPSGRA